MIHICFMIPSDLPVPATRGGGVETLVTNLINENEIQHRLKMTVICANNFSAEKQSHHYKYTDFTFLPYPSAAYRRFAHYMFGAIRHLTGKRFLDKWNKAELQAALSHKPDFIINENGHMDGFSAYQRVAIPIIYHLHFNPAKRFKNLGYSHVFAVSNFVGNTWKSNNRGIPAGVTTIHNCVNDSFFHVQGLETRQETRKKLGLKPDDFAILYCGRIVPEKGILELIQAFSRIQDPKVKLIVIGSSASAGAATTTYSQRVHKKLRELGDRVRELGFQPHDLVPTYQSACDVEVLPTLVEDAAPLSAIEAMAAGIPLIASRSGGVPEYVPSTAALLVNRGSYFTDELAKALITLKNNKSKRVQMSAAGKQAAQHFTQKQFYNNFYHALIDIQRYQHK